MAIFRTGEGTGDGLWEVDPTANAAVGSVRGQEIGSGGFYRVSLNSGTISARSAADILYVFQNPSTSGVLSIILGVSIGFRGIAGSATSSSFVASLYATRSYTVLDTTNASAAVSFKGQMLTQTRATQANSQYRITNTTAITGGTGTDDAQPLASLVFTHPGIVTTLFHYPFFPPVLSEVSHPQYPLILAAGEGFRIRTDQAWTTGNTAVCCVDVEWVEVSAY